MKGSSLYARLMMKITKTSSFLALPLIAFCLIGCVESKSEIQPHLSYAVQDKYLQSLHSIFDPLKEEEKETRWGQEYELGLAFAKKLDLYRAVTCFKRADILIDPQLAERRAEIQYQIVNCYYLGNRYSDAIESFEESSLASTDRTFVAFRDLLVILFDSYMHEKDVERATWMIKALERYFPLDAKKLHLTSAVHRAAIDEMQEISTDMKPEMRLAELKDRMKGTSEIFLEEEEEIIGQPKLVAQTQVAERAGNLTFEEQLEFDELSTYTDCKKAVTEIEQTYMRFKKSPALAGTLNALLPGMGYLYLGQKQTAFTSFCLNSLFIAATGYFIKEGNIPAAVITAGFESGWYFGGIVGARENAVFYNERLYEKESHVRLRDHKLYPILMLNHGF